jgi:ferredoxin
MNFPMNATMNTPMNRYPQVCSQTDAPVEVSFQPAGVVVKARPGEAWLAVAARAGIEIPTGCLAGSCGACEVELEAEDLQEVCRTCIGTVPDSFSEITVYLLQDPTW